MHLSVITSVHQLPNLQILDKFYEKVKKEIQKNKY